MTNNLILHDLIEKICYAINPDLGKTVVRGSSITGNHLSVEFFNDVISNAPMYKPKSKSFVHFTSLKTLQSIINERAIRMYNLNNVNDPNEFRYIASGLFDNEKQIKAYKDCCFVLSLCDATIMDSSDILNLWRLYGQNGTGVLIELEFDDRFLKSSNLLLSNVVYDAEQKANLMNNLKGVKSIIEDAEVNEGLVIDPFKIINALACIHKSPYYEIEKEVRLVRFSNYKNKTDLMKSDSEFKIDLNNSNESVAYYNLPLNKGDVNIKRIQFGFKHAKNFNHLESHFGVIFHNLWRNQKIMNEPTIEVSPLEGIFI